MNIFVRYIWGCMYTHIYIYMYFLCMECWCGGVGLARAQAPTATETTLAEIDRAISALRPATGARLPRHCRIWTCGRIARETPGLLPEGDNVLHLDCVPFKDFSVLG